MNTDTPGRRAKKTLRVFAASSFLNDMGSDMIYPVWPLFVTEVFKADMAALGFLDGLGDALVSLSQAGSGYLSDRLKKRKIFIWLGYLSGSLSRLGYAAAAVWPHLIPSRVLDRLGKIRNPPRDAEVADLSTSSNRGRNFGLLRAMDNLGAVCGILLAIVFLNALGYRRLFALAAVPSLIAAALILLFIKPAKTDRSKAYKGLSFRDLDRNFKLFLVLCGLFALGAFSYSFLLIYARRAGYRTAAIPVLYLVFTATASLLSLPFGRLSDRIGRKPVLHLAFFFWAAVCVIVMARPGRLLLPLIFVFYGIHRAALDPVQKTLITELSPADRRAGSLGGFQMIIGLCALPASLGAGWLWVRLGDVAPFALSLGLTLVAIVLLFFVREKQSPSSA
jgi:MFS family permease